MGAQEFATVDVLRLDVEADPTGLVNLVQNPSGELGGWGWVTTIPGSKVSTTSLLVDTYPALYPSTYSGDALPASDTSLRFAGVAGASWFTTEDMPISAGQWAAARWNALGGSAGHFFRARFEWINLAGAVISSSVQSGYLSVFSGVGNLGAVQAPAGTVAVRLRFDLYSNNTGTNPTGAHTFDFAEVTVAKAATAAELGAVRTNLVTNPSFETNAAGWTALSGAIARSTAQANRGTAALRHTTSGGGGSSAAFEQPITASMTVTAGSTYAGQCVVKQVSGLRRSVRLRVAWRDASNAVVGYTDLGTAFASSTSWVKLSGVAVAPVGATKACLRIEYGEAPAAGWEFDFDAFLFEAGSTVGYYFDGSTPAGSGWTYTWTGTAHASASTALNSSLQYLAPVQYLNIIGESHELKIGREALNVGTLDALIISRALDPAESNLIRPGRRARLMSLVEGTWEEIVTGKLLEANVEYELKDPSVPDEKRSRISVSLVDANQPLAQAKRPQGVATIDELPFVLEGAGVPWNVNGSGNQVAIATPTTFNADASALTQLALTRDTNIGYVWTSRRGVVNAWDPGSMPAPAPLVLNETDYSDLKVTYGTSDCINAVSFTVQTLGADGNTVETTYGPYEDAPSIAAYGRYLKEFTVTGLSKAQVDTLAASILAANKTPVRRVQSVTMPLNTLARVNKLALIDLYDLVRVDNAELGLSAQLRVTGIEHSVQLKKWMLTLTFAGNGSVASPIFQPPVQSDANPDVGVIEWFAGPVAKIPASKLLCDGSSKAVASYPYLFAMIGYTYGGSGANFNVPNLVDRFAIGAGTKALGTTGGAPTKTLTAANLPPHNHATGTNAGHLAYGGSAGSGPASGSGFGTPLTSISTGNGPGTSTPFDIMPPWLALVPVIRAA